MSGRWNKMAGMRLAVMMMAMAVSWVSSSGARAAEGCGQLELAQSIESFRQDLESLKGSRTPGFEEAEVLSPALIEKYSAGQGAAAAVSAYRADMRAQGRALTRWVLKSNIEALTEICAVPSQT